MRQTMHPQNPVEQWLLEDKRLATILDRSPDPGDPTADEYHRILDLI